MAWSSTILDAAYEGIPFDVISTDDDIQRSVAEHAVAYLDGAALEDLGSGAVRYRMQAIFFGDDYEARFQDLMWALELPGPGELVHPIYGVVQVQFTGCQLHHEAENRDQVTVQLEFTEATPGNPFFDRELPVQEVAAVDGSIELALDDVDGWLVDGLEALAAGLTDLISLASGDQIRALAGDLLDDLLGDLPGFILSGLDVLDFPRAFAADIRGIFSELADQFQFAVGDGDGVSGGGGSLSGFDRIVEAFSHSELVSDVDLAMPRPIVTRTVADLNRLIRVQDALGIARGATELLAHEIDTPTLFPRDIERVVAVSRSALQGAIDDFRAVSQTGDLLVVRQAGAASTLINRLQDVALGVQRAGIAVVGQRAPISIRTVPTTTTLHRLAHDWYGDYTRAPELARLNPQVANPNRLSQGDMLHAFTA